jgi:hypothetical protein
MVGFEAARVRDSRELDRQALIYEELRACHACLGGRPRRGYAHA